MTEATVKLPTPDEISAAHERIGAYIRRTPVFDPGAGAFDLPFNVTLKLEHLQHSGSFKARGAFNSLLSGDLPQNGVAAASGGNHGAAVAYAAERLKVRADIFVPETSSPAKIARIRDAGANLHIGGKAYAEAASACAEHQARTGAVDIHAYDAPGTVEGQGTLALEWERQSPELDTVLIAVGGGGLIAGIASWFQRRVKVVGVEPIGASALHSARAAGRPVPVEINSLAADSLGARSCGTRAFSASQDGLIDDVVLVTDDMIRSAQLRLWRQTQLAAEPGGATALAALIGGAYRPANDERVGVLICGGNLDPALLKA